MGVIVRTASAGKSKEVFAEDLESIVKLYHEIEKKAAKKKRPRCCMRSSRCSSAPRATF